MVSQYTRKVWLQLPSNWKAGPYSYKTCGYWSYSWSFCYLFWKHPSPYMDPFRHWNFLHMTRPPPLSPKAFIPFHFKADGLEATIRFHLVYLIYWFENDMELQELFLSKGELIFQIFILGYFLVLFGTFLRTSFFGITAFRPLPSRKKISQAGHNRRLSLNRCHWIFESPRWLGTWRIITMASKWLTTMVSKSPK